MPEKLSKECKQCAYWDWDKKKRYKGYTDTCPAKIRDGKKK